MDAATATNRPPALGLGLDAGGTQTRWAVADAQGHLHAEGSAAPISGLQLASEAGRAQVLGVLRTIAAACGPVRGAVTGLTGFDAADAPALCALLVSALGVAPSAAQALSDIELACRAAFAPGEGCVVYAGTGSIAAFIDTGGTLQRAGGRGVVIDDAGGGHWLAREALRHVWRLEDEAPGSAAATALGQQVFAQVGGSDWSHTRAWVYGATRGELGTLALAVARAADADRAALDILQRAGGELARLALALLRRHGARPVALAGRVFDLHPAIEHQLRAALPASTPLQRLTLPAHHAAARSAAALNDSPRT